MMQRFREYIEESLLAGVVGLGMAGLGYHVGKSMIHAYRMSRNPELRSLMGGLDHAEKHGWDWSAQNTWTHKPSGDTVHLHGDEPTALKQAGGWTVRDHTGQTRRIGTSFAELHDYMHERHPDA
jgi:hypothetical protein